MYGQSSRLAPSPPSRCPTWAPWSRCLQAPSELPPRRPRVRLAAVMTELTARTAHLGDLDPSLREIPRQPCPVRPGSLHGEPYARRQLNSPTCPEGLPLFRSRPGPIPRGPVHYSCSELRTIPAHQQSLWVSTPSMTARGTLGHARSIGARLVEPGRRRQVCMRTRGQRETGLEPATSTLGRLHSTVELLPLAPRIGLDHFPPLLCSVVHLPHSTEIAYAW